MANEEKPDRLKPAEEHFITASGRPQEPDWKERVRGGASAPEVLAEFEAHHRARNTFNGQGGAQHSSTYRWLKAQAAK